MLAEEGGEDARVVVRDAAVVGADDVAWGVIVGEEVEEDVVEEDATIEDVDGGEAEGSMRQRRSYTMSFSGIDV